MLTLGPRDNLGSSPYLKILNLVPLQSPLTLGSNTVSGGVGGLCVDIFGEPVFSLPQAPPS